MSAQGRLMQEYQTLAKQTTPSVFARPDEDDVMHWTALIVGPPNTPYARGLFHFDMRFPRDYPNTPPKVLITTTSSANVRFNPNLYNNGKVSARPRRSGGSQLGARARARARRRS